MRKGGSARPLNAGVSSQMTRRSLQLRFRATVAIYALAVVAAVGLRVLDDTYDQVIYGTYKDVLPLIIALPAIWLGYCLQRRNSYMQQLRILWSKLVDSIQCSNQYTFIENPTPEQFAKTLQAMSVAIDEVRGAFMNLGESSQDVGLYPFEPLKQIHEVLRKLGCGPSATETKRERARDEILELWKAVRQELLREFDREEPTFHHSHYADTAKRNRAR
jgi:hypothetical protein